MDLLPYNGSEWIVLTIVSLAASFDALPCHTVHYVRWQCILIYSEYVYICLNKRSKWTAECALTRGVRSQTRSQAHTSHYTIAHIHTDRFGVQWKSVSICTKLISTSDSNWKWLLFCVRSFSSSYPLIYSILLPLPPPLLLQLLFLNSCAHISQYLNFLCHHHHTAAAASASVVVIIIIVELLFLRWWVDVTCIHHSKQSTKSTRNSWVIFYSSHSNRSSVLIYRWWVYILFYLILIGYGRWSRTARMQRSSTISFGIVDAGSETKDAHKHFARWTILKSEIIHSLMA